MLQAYSLRAEGRPEFQIPVESVAVMKSLLCCCCCCCLGCWLVVVIKFSNY